MGDIDLLIMNTIPPDHADPGSAFFLQGKLDLPGIAVLEGRQQCAGLIFGLGIADSFIRTGRCRYALDEARKAGRAPDGSLVMLVAFGSGFVWASALLRM